MEKQAEKKNVKQKKKYKLTKFAKFMMIYVALFVVGLICLFIYLWNFIGDYEASMAVHGMERAIVLFEEDNLEKLVNESDKEITALSEFEDVTIVKKYILDNIRNKELTYKKAKTFTKKLPVFEVFADNKSVAEVVLKKNKTTDNRFGIWEYDYTTFAKSLPSTQKITITAPSNAIVCVNGKEVAKKYLSGEPKTIEELKRVEQYISSVPTMVTYEIEGIINQPQVTAVNEYGVSITASVTENNYSFGLGTKPNLMEENSEYIRMLMELYGKNFINKGNTIRTYIYPDSELLEAIKLASTYFYPNSKIKSYQFDNVVIDNFVGIGEDCYICHVKYDLNVYFTGYKVDHINEAADMNWYMVDKDDNWYITAIDYN